MNASTTSAAALDPASPGKGLMEVFASMSATEVPGTYAARAEGVTKSVLEALRRELTPEQFRAFEALGHDPLDVEVTDNPWNGYVLDVQRRREK